ncbi:unnamed protein product, partial [Callosobruchus maculatus]
MRIDDTQSHFSTMLRLFEQKPSTLYYLSFVKAEDRSTALKPDLPAPATVF